MAVVIIHIPRGMHLVVIPALKWLRDGFSLYFLHPTHAKSAAWWGGLGSCGAYATGIGVLLHHLNCHEHGCPRIVRRGHTHCKKHRDLEDQQRDRDIQRVARAHAAARTELHSAAGS